MDEPHLTTEQRLARLEAKSEARSLVFTLLLLLGFVVYLVASSGHLKFVTSVNK